MNKKYHTDSVYFCGIASLAIIVVSSILAISPFLQQALAQETQTTNATNLVANQSSSPFLDSVLNITRTAGDDAKSTAAEYVINATPSNNSMNLTNTTIVGNSNTS
jgi:hypothetical protein